MQTFTFNVPTKAVTTRISSWFIVMEIRCYQGGENRWMICSPVCTQCKVCDSEIDLMMSQHTAVWQYLHAVFHAAKVNILHFSHLKWWSVTYQCLMIISNEGQYADSGHKTCCYKFLTDQHINALYHKQNILHFQITPATLITMMLRKWPKLQQAYDNCTSFSNKQVYHTAELHKAGYMTDISCLNKSSFGKRLLMLAISSVVEKVVNTSCCKQHLHVQYLLHVKYHECKCTLHKHTKYKIFKK